MIKLILEKTVFRQANKESQERLVKLLSRKFIIMFLSDMIWPVLFMSQFILTILIDILEEGEFPKHIQIAINVYIVISFIIFLIFLKFFHEQMIAFSLLIGNKIYFNLCTKSGKAIEKADFEKIKEKNEELFYCIETGTCKGYCYSVCFYILKALEKGNIEFVAIKEIIPENEGNKESYTLHVLYVNNGWAFDTYSVRQYPVEEIHMLEGAKVFRSFDFKQLSDLSYYKFWKENHQKVSEWCLRNDCSETWSQYECEEE